MDPGAPGRAASARVNRSAMSPVSNSRSPVATAGVVENGNSALLVTVSSEGTLLDRRSVELTEALPTHPHHHEGSWALGRYANTPGARAITLTEAVALVARVKVAAEVGARRHLAELAAAVSSPIVGIALRAYPELPPTTELRITDHRAQTYADSAMYREALAGAARERGWAVHWYDRERVFAEASAALGRSVDGLLAALGRANGPPWQAKHKLAAAAALAVCPAPRVP